MNDFERKKAIELKEAGLGYGAIAKTLGLPKSTISSFLRTLSRYTLCKCCGKKFIQPKGKRNKIFCSDKCRYKYRYITNKGKEVITNYEVECIYCHKKFYSYKSLKRKFCSWKCYDAYRKGGGNNGQN